MIDNRKCIFRRGVGCAFDSIATTKAAAMRNMSLWRKRGDMFWGLVLTTCSPVTGLATDVERPDAVFKLTAEEIGLLTSGRASA